MNSFDTSILDFLAPYGQISAHLNLWMQVISENDVFKGIISMAMFWWAWNMGENDEERRANRQTLLVTILGAFFALLLGRVFQVTLPFRDRPMNDAALHFLMPLGTERKMEAWSSFPSDHAALFFSLATGGWLISRRVGVFCFIYVSLFVALPRAFLGLHYPTDLLVGALLGIGCTAFASLGVFRRRIADPLLNFSERYQAAFTCALFLLTFQIATLFDSLRELGHFIMHGTLKS